MPADREHTTRLLRALTEGEGEASAELLPLVYDELRGIARRLLEDQRACLTLQPTELIHEAYLRLIGDQARWDGRSHFKRVAARAMRYVLVDHARTKLRDKRGGDHRRVTLDTQLAAVVDDAAQILAIHDGLEKLAAFESELAQIVELKFFGGLTIEEIAQALGSSKSSVDRGWRLARAWWIQEFETEGGDA